MGTGDGRIHEPTEEDENSSCWANGKEENRESAAPPASNLLSPTLFTDDPADGEETDTKGREKSERPSEVNTNNKKKKKRNKNKGNN
jgi:hypothetical protein